MYDELFNRDGFAALVAMKEISRLRGQSAGPQGLAKEIDDIALAPELAIASVIIRSEHPADTDLKIADAAE